MNIATNCRSAYNKTINFAPIGAGQPTLRSGCRLWRRYIAMILSAKFIESNLEDWKYKERLFLGTKGGLSAPSIWVEVSVNGVPFKLIDLFAYDENTCFKSIKVVGSVLIIGFGESVHFINMKSNDYKSIRLDGYFGEMYTPEDFGLKDNEFGILVTSCDYLYHFSLIGEELWKSVQLGIDGVIVHEVTPPLIKISGEWDPLGGWEEKTVNLSDGRVAI